MFMNLAWLEDFLALAESGNFSRAAEQRHTKSWRIEVEIRLFRRMPGEPPAAEALWRAAGRT